jgi:hypothetical protein
MAGGGIGEAALIGAAVGGGSALLTGQDPFLGIVKGGAFGGLGGAFGGAGAGASGAVNPAAAAANEALGANATQGMLTSFVDPTKYGAVQDIVSGQGGIPATLAGANVIQQGVPGIANAVPAPGMVGGLMDKYNALSTPEKIGVGIAGSTLLSKLMEPNYLKEGDGYQPLKRFTYDPRKFRPTVAYADGGIASLPGGNISVGGDPRRNISPIEPSSNWQQSSFPVNYMADGGITNLGHYSDGGSLLRGPGDGVSDDIPAMIGRKQPARLADGEFVVPARIVSELGNGSTDAGARQLYKMMDRVQARRGKTTGKDRMAVDSKARKLLPA